MPTDPIPCPASRWTRVFAGPSAGALTVAAWPPGTPARYRVLTLNLPFYLEGQAVLDEVTRLPTGLPAIYTVLDILPQWDASVSVG